MTREEYEIYRATPRWRKLSGDLKRMRKKCENCAFPYELDVHHKNYQRIGAERLGDLVVLCRACHMRSHFLDDMEKLPIMESLLGNSTKARQRILRQQAEARAKNLDRAYEVDALLKNPPF